MATSVEQAPKYGFLLRSVADLLCGVDRIVERVAQCTDSGVGAAPNRRKVSVGSFPTDSCPGSVLSPSVKLRNLFSAEMNQRLDTRRSSGMDADGSGGDLPPAPQNVRRNTHTSVSPTQADDDSDVLTYAAEVVQMVMQLKDCLSNSTEKDPLRQWWYQLPSFIATGMASAPTKGGEEEVITVNAPGRQSSQQAPLEHETAFVPSRTRARLALSRTPTSGDLPPPALCRRVSVRDLSHVTFHKNSPETERLSPKPQPVHDGDHQAAVSSGVARSHPLPLPVPAPAPAPALPQTPYSELRILPSPSHAYLRPGLTRNDTSSMFSEAGPMSPINVRMLRGTTVVASDGTPAICQFEIIQELGRGNFGIVSLAVDQDGDAFAVKSLKNVSLKGSRKLAAERRFSNAISNASTPSLGSPISAGGISPKGGMPVEVGSPDALPGPPQDRPVGAPGPSVPGTVVEHEIAIMKKLNHKNVVKLYCVIEDPDESETHLVMQYVPNGPVAKVETGGTCSPLPFQLALFYMAQVSTGLDYLHAKRIVHRDVKPENILLGDNNQAFVTDFGISSVLCEADASPVHGGTAAFISPELISTTDLERYGIQADVWAFGVTLYALLFGKMPFFSRSMVLLVRNIINNDVTFPGTLPAAHCPPFADCTLEQDSSESVPPQLPEICRRLLDKDPKKRMLLREFRHHPFVVQCVRECRHARLSKKTSSISDAEMDVCSPGGTRTQLMNQPVAMDSLFSPTAAEALDFDVSISTMPTEDELRGAVMHCSVVMHKSQPPSRTASHDDLDEVPEVSSFELRLRKAVQAANASRNGGDDQ